MSTRSVFHNSFHIDQWRSYVPKVMMHTPAVVGMLAVAALVCKIWGMYALVCAVVGTGLVYGLFQRQIDWLIESNDWLPSAIRSLVAPCFAIFGGPIGAGVGLLVAFVSNIGEQWNAREQRSILEEANRKLKKTETALNETIETLRTQINESSEAVQGILQKCPAIEEQLQKIDGSSQQFGDAVVAIDVDRAKLVQLLEHYRQLLQTPDIAERVQTIAKIEGHMATMNTQLARFNDNIRQQNQSGLEAADLQTENLVQVSQLIQKLNELILNLTTPSE